MTEAQTVLTSILARHNPRLDTFDWEEKRSCRLVSNESAPEAIGLGGGAELTAAQQRGGEQQQETHPQRKADAGCPGGRRLCDTLPGGGGVYVWMGGRERAPAWRLSQRAAISLA